MSNETDLERTARLQAHLYQRLDAYRAAGYTMVGLPQQIVADDEQQIEATLQQVAAAELAQRQAAPLQQVPLRGAPTPAAFPLAAASGVGPSARPTPPSVAEELQVLTSREAVEAAHRAGPGAIAAHKARMAELIGAGAAPTVKSLTSEDSIRSGAYSANRQALLEQVRRSGVAPTGLAPFAATPRYEPPTRASSYEVPRGLPTVRSEQEMARLQQASRRRRGG